MFLGFSYWVSLWPTGALASMVWTESTEQRSANSKGKWTKQQKQWQSVDFNHQRAALQPSAEGCVHQSAAAAALGATESALASHRWTGNHGAHSRSSARAPQALAGPSAQQQLFFSSKLQWHWQPSSAPPATITTGSASQAKVNGRQLGLQSSPAAESVRHRRRCTGRWCARAHAYLPPAIWQQQWTTAAAVAFNFLYCNSINCYKQRLIGQSGQSATGSGNMAVFNGETLWRFCCRVQSGGAAASQK